MNCDEIQQLLPELAREELSPALDAMVRGHVNACGACASILHREESLHRSLKSLPSPRMAVDFPARAMQAARQADRRRHQHPALRQAALAASVLMMVGLGFILGRGSQAPTGGSEVLAVNLAVGEAEMVALKINAPQAFEHVEFEVTLPENVALQDQPELREFAWSGQLQAGVNVLSLPLVGVRAAGGQLVAKVKFGNNEKSLRIPLTVVTRG